MNTKPKNFMNDLKSENPITRAELNVPLIKLIGKIGTILKGIEKYQYQKGYTKTYEYSLDLLDELFDSEEMKVADPLKVEVFKFIVILVSSYGFPDNISGTCQLKFSHGDVGFNWDQAPPEYCTRILINIFDPFQASCRLLAPDMNVNGVNPSKMSSMPKQARNRMNKMLPKHQVGLGKNQMGLMDQKLLDCRGQVERIFNHKKLIKEHRKKRKKNKSLPKLPKFPIKYMGMLIVDFKSLDGKPRKSVLDLPIKNLNMKLEGPPPTSEKGVEDFINKISDRVIDSHRARREKLKASTSGTNGIAKPRSPEPDSKADSESKTSSTITSTPEVTEETTENTPPVGDSATGPPLDNSDKTDDQDMNDMLDNLEEDDEIEVVKVSS